MSRYTYVYSTKYGAYKKISNGEKALKKKKNTLRKIAKFLIFTLIFSFSFLLVFKLVNYLTTSPSFEVKKIRINAKSQRTEEMLKEITSKYIGKNLFLINPYDIKDELKKLPEFKEIVVRKEFPSTLILTVEEKIPFLMLKNHKYLLIDKNGDVIKTSFKKFNIDVPLIFFNGGDVLNLIPYDELDKFIHSRYYKKDMIIYFIEPFGITVLENNKKIFLGKNNLLKKWDHFLALKKELKQSNTEFEYIDLRFDDRAYLMPVQGGLNE